MTANSRPTSWVEGNNNLVSTQLLGWWVVPAAFRAFEWWLAPKASVARQLGGCALVTAIYAAAMGFDAFLLAWNWAKAERRNAVTSRDGRLLAAR